jgi:broad specificity phosphatase PhoE
MQLVPRGDRPKRLVLVRHGRTEWNRVGRAQGFADIPLDDVGRMQAANAAQQLAAYEPSFLWSSDLIRALETAEAIAAATGLEIEVDERLREFDVGVRQGLTFGEFEAAYPDIFARFRAGEHIDVPGAETAAQVSERMVALLRDAAAKVGEGETGILVGHGASLRTGLLAFFRAPDHLREMLAGMSNGAWAVLELHHDRGWQIIDYNAQTLPGPLDLADDLGTS